MPNRMIDPKLKEFLDGLTKDELFATLEAARVALADGDIADEVGLELSMSDPDLNNLQNKIHQFMKNL